MNNKLLLLSVVLAGGLVCAHLISSLTVNASSDETIVKAEKEIVKKGYTFKVRNKAPGQGVSGVHAPSKNQAHQGPKIAPEDRAQFLNDSEDPDALLKKQMDGLRKIAGQENLDDDDASLTKEEIAQLEESRTMVW